MDREMILAKVVELARMAEPRFDGQAVQLDDTPLSAHGLTSLSMLRLTALVQDGFGITITDAEGLRAGTPIGLVGLIERKLGRSPRA